MTLLINWAPEKGKQITQFVNKITYKDVVNSYDDQNQQKKQNNNLNNLSYQNNNRDHHPYKNTHNNESQYLIQNIKEAQKKIESHVKIKKISQYPIQREGLPNLGNTCFLNSIIQLLVSSENLRELLLESKTNQKVQSQQNEYYSFQNRMNSSTNHTIYSYLKQIVNKIAYNASLHQKRKTMQKIIRYLYINNINYQNFSQQDSLQFLLFILNKIFSYNKSLSKLFNINFLQKCKNRHNIRNRQFQQFTIDQIQFKCKVCSKKNYITFLNQPKIVLFIATEKYSRPLQQLIYFQNISLNEDPFPINPSISYFVYKLKGKILYSGSGRSGHYVAARRLINEDNQSQNAPFYQFNDANIQQMSPKHNQYNFKRSYYSTFHQKVCLYEYFQNISQKQYQKRQGKKEVKIKEQLAQSTIQQQKKRYYQQQQNKSLKKKEKSSSINDQYEKQKGQRVKQKQQKQRLKQKQKQKQQGQNIILLEQIEQTEDKKKIQDKKIRSKYILQQLAKQAQLKKGIYYKIQQQKQKKRRSSFSSLSCCFYTSQENKQKSNFETIQIIHSSQIVFEHKNNNSKQLIYWKLIKAQNGELLIKFIKNQQYNKMSQKNNPHLINQGELQLPQVIKIEFNNQFNNSIAQIVNFFET